MKLTEQAAVRISKRDQERLDALAARGIPKATVIRVALRLGLAELESEASQEFVNVLAGAA